MPHRIRLPFIMLSVAVLLWAGAGSASAGMPIYPHQSTGNRGSNVMALQGLLRQHGAVLRISGIFDAPTVAAVRAFQAGRGLPVTGMADGVTWTRMLVRLASGSTGEAVKVVQRQLNDKRRAGLVVDGVFGGRTYAAVRTFQRHARLPVTGTVDPTTWRYLISHFQRPTFNRFVCDYQVGNGPADWGTGAAIGQVRAAAVTVVGRGHGPIAIGDIGHEHGGDIRGHESHELGFDVDIRPMRTRPNGSAAGAAVVPHGGVRPGRDA